MQAATDRTNDHSGPGNCRAAPRATGPRHIALFPGPPPPRCIAHRARSAPAQLTAAPRRFVCAFGFALPHPVSSCGCERTGSLPLCKRKSAPVTRCAFFWLPLLGSNQRPFRARKLSRCTTGHRPVAHRSVSGPASASLHRPLGALGSGAVNSRPEPFCLCVRFCFAAPRQLLRL